MAPNPRGQRDLAKIRTENPNNETRALDREASDAPTSDVHDAVEQGEQATSSNPPRSGTSHATDWQAPPPRLPAVQVEPLPAVKVAVIGLSALGELRLVPLDGRSVPPTGAALGILVPLTAADGEALVRLLDKRD
jgi:hypothetical protein